MIDKTDASARADSPAPATPFKSASSNNESPRAIIGPKIRIKGDLSGDEDILIQGRVEGTIELKENSLTIGENGSVKANAVTKSITIQGEVEGDLYGAEKIVIRESSNVRGNLVSPRVSLEDGAKFRGSIDMDAEPKSISGITSSNSKDSKPASPSNTSQSDSSSSGGSGNKPK